MQSTVKREGGVSSYTDAYHQKGQQEEATNTSRFEYETRSQGVKHEPKESSEHPPYPDCLEYANVLPCYKIGNWTHEYTVVGMVAQKQ
jgi:hypothetical protein